MHKSIQKTITIILQSTTHHSQLPYASVLQVVESDYDTNMAPWTQRIHGMLLQLDQKFQISYSQKVFH